ncbi:MAG: response regulator transcription factor [Chitinophagaceae bacterium]
MNKVKILVVEDNEIMALYIQTCLNNIDFELSAVATNSAEALHQLETNLPDAVLLDINLKDSIDGIEVAELVNEKYKIPFLFITSLADKQTLERAKKTNPSGYIVKPFKEQDLLVGLEMALYNFAQRNNVTQPQLSLANINKHLVKPLSEREFEILQCIYEGKTNQQMASALYLSVNTIKTHINNLYLKLDASSRSSVLARVRSWQQ